MSAEWGTLKESLKPAPPASSSSRAEKRAARSSPGAWDEDLGRWGAGDWHLPGFGESGPRCGEYYPEAACETCGEPNFGTHRCGRRSCPDCWGIWAQKAAVRATVRVQSFRETQPDNYKRQAGHAVVSSPEGDVMNEREFYNGRSRAAEIAEEKGFRGFAVVPHPWRVTDDGKDEWRRDVARDDDGDPVVGVWVWLRRNHDEEGLKQRIYWSPHYHIIGSTSADMDPGDESDEWLYQFIRSFERYDGTRDKESHGDVYGAFRYLYSHTGFPAGSTKQTTTWYGDLANNVFVEEATEEWQNEKPSEGVRDVIRRTVEEVAAAGESDDDGGGGADDDERDECPRDGCEGLLVGVFDITAYLRHHDPPTDVAEKMQLARDWRLGRIQPPPGLRRPRSKEEAKEVFEAF